MNSKNIHLVISVLIIVPAAFIYGWNPQRILPLIFDIQVETIDLKSVFRALFGLYLVMAAFWTYAVYKPGLWKAATISNIAFMGGIGLGRLLGILLDGWPSPTFAFGVLGELVLAGFGVYQLKRYG